MDKYVIEKGVPIPQGKHDSLTAMLRKMEVGDSLVAPTKTAIGGHATASRLGIKIIVRPEDGRAGISRIWRVQ